MPLLADNHNFIFMAEMWDTLRAIFLCLPDECSNYFPKDIIRCYNQLNPSLSPKIINFSVNVLRILMESFIKQLNLPINFFTFTEIQRESKENNQNFKFLENLLARHQWQFENPHDSDQSKIITPSIFSVLYDDFLNYVLLLPNAVINDAFVLCTTFSEFRTFTKKYMKSQNLQLQGRYSTPNHIARFIVDKILENQHFSPELKILDLCSGTGVFCMEICNSLLELYHKHFPNMQIIKIKQHIIKQNLCAIDIDPISTYILRIHLLCWFLKSQPVSSQIDEFIANVLRITTIGNVLSNHNIFSQKFDIIVSNPPYLSEKSHKHYFDSIIERKSADFYKPRLDYYLHFLIYAFEQINTQGVLGFIMPIYFMQTNSASKIRKYLWENTRRLEFYDYSDQSLFLKAPGFHCGLFLFYTGKNVGINEKFAYYYVPGSNTFNKFHYSDLFSSQHQYIMKFREKSRWEKLEALTRTLSDIAEIRQGVIAGPDRVRKKHLLWINNENVRPNLGVFVLSKEELEQMQLAPLENESILPFYYARDLKKQYYLLSDEFQPQHYIIYLNRYNLKDLTLFPNLQKHLLHFKPIMDKRREVRNAKRKWFELHWARTLEIFTLPRILSVRRTKSPRFIYTEIPFATDLATNIILPSQDINTKNLYEYLISPEIIEWISYFAKIKGHMMQIDRSLLEKIPIPNHI